MTRTKIVVLSIVAAAIGIGLVQQITAPARAAAPVVRATYQGIGSGVNENVAVIWLLGSDGGIKICTHAATGANADAPVCSASVTP
ncbi:MAG TPA: hypothetical protein VNH44_17545 [Micropepsaceae bacterium]|nr:hypothetical protein [Micropepsaceae bacterium]